MISATQGWNGNKTEAREGHHETQGGNRLQQCKSICRFVRPDELIFPPAFDARSSGIERSFLNYCLELQLSIGFVQLCEQRIRTSIQNHKQTFDEDEEIEVIPDGSTKEIATLHRLINVEGKKSVARWRLLQDEEANRR